MVSCMEMWYSNGEVINMATKAHLEGNKRYLEKLDHYTIRFPGGAKEKIMQHAKESGKSLNAYIIGLIEADMGKLSAE